MVKNVPKSAKRRRPRTAKTMELANRKTEVKPRDARVRAKGAPRRTKANMVKRATTKAWRLDLSKVQRRIYYAIKAASARFLATVTARPRVRGKGIYKKAPSKIKLHPDNYSTLLALLKPDQRSKPTQIGQEVIYVLPKAAPMLAWLSGEVVYLAPHKESNWVVVKKPWALKPDENPFLAIDSRYAYLAPRGSHGTVSLLKDKGLYTLYCKSRDEYYVGVSNDIPARVREHEAGCGSAVTKKWNGEVERLRPLTNGKGSYQAAELKEVWALAKKFVRGGKRENIYAEREGTRVRGAGYSSSQ